MATLAYLIHVQRGDVGLFKSSHFDVKKGRAARDRKVGIQRHKDPSVKKAMKRNKITTQSKRRKGENPISF